MLRWRTGCSHRVGQRSSDRDTDDEESNYPQARVGRCHACRKKARACLNPPLNSTTDRIDFRPQTAGIPSVEPSRATPELGFEPSPEAPQAPRTSILPYWGAPVASRRRYYPYPSAGGTYASSTAIA